MFMVLAVILSCAFLFSGCKQNVGTPEDNAVPDEDTQSDADTENGEEAEEEDSFLLDLPRSIWKILISSPWNLRSAR